MKTGRIVWSQQVLPNNVYNSACGSKGPNCPVNSGPDFDFGSSALLVQTSDGRDLLVALDPERQGACSGTTTRPAAT